MAVFVHAIVAAIGLSAVLATSTMAFNIVKYLGAIYPYISGNQCV
jgi:threonine/homoserine/homoserine lactone efflux protein